MALHAGTIYTNLGPGDSYSTGQGISLGSSGLVSIGIRFVATGSGSLDSILLPLAVTSNGPSSLGL
jgi:hypothetical protein